MRGRERFSLDHGWKFWLGDVDAGPIKSHNEVYGSCKAGGLLGPPHANWDDHAWETVDVPHDWVTKLDFDPTARANHGYKHRGTGWYRKCFRLEESARGKHILLEFDGIATHAQIYLNGSVVQRNFSGYNSFAVDVTERCFFGERPNVLAVKVETDCFEGWWYEGAGIYRHVYLTCKEPLHIAHWGTWVNPQKQGDDQWQTLVETTIENSSYEQQTFTLVSIVRGPNGQEVGRTTTTSVCTGGERVVIEQTIPVVDPLLWDVEQPHLHTLVSELYVTDSDVCIDTEATRFGYRTIRVCPERGFFLNEKPLKLKGTCNHQDHAGVGVALPDAIHTYRIRRLKEMGSNAYRCAHHNPAKEILDACDELGMLVMNENRQFEASDEVIRQVEQMVRRDRNHPCVVMYSIFNEEPLQGTAEGRAIYRKLAHVIKRLDRSRPVTGALNGGVMQEEGTATAMDVTGINYNLRLLDAFHEKYPHQPIVASESASAFSTRGVYETDSAQHVFDSYDLQKASWGATVRENWEAVNTRDFVMGTFIWTGFDYLGEPTPHTWPSVSTAFGILDTCGFAKDAFYLYKAFWSQEPVLHIVPSHWNWQGREGEPIHVMTHTNCEEVELWLNDVSLGRQKVPLYEQASWDVPFTPGKLVMRGYCAGEVMAEARVETTGQAHALCLEPDRDVMWRDGLDAMPVQVSAVDADGRFVALAEHQVTFSISGAGRLLGVGNGNPNSHEPFVSRQRRLFNGRCQAIIQSSVDAGNVDEGAGEWVLVAEAEGLEPAQLRIPLHQPPTEPMNRLESVFTQYLANWRMTQELVSVKPDPQVEIQDSDMNTWEPVVIHNGPQSRFDGHSGAYALYRTTFTIPASRSSQSYSIMFPAIHGSAEIYVNGQLLAAKECPTPSPMRVKVPSALVGEQTLTVLLQAIGDKAGICKPVSLVF